LFGAQIALVHVRVNRSI